MAMSNSHIISGQPDASPFCTFLLQALKRAFLFIYFIIMCLCPCVCKCKCMWMPIEARIWHQIGYFVVGLTGSCKLPALGVGSLNTIVSPALERMLLSLKFFMYRSPIVVN